MFIVLRPVTAKIRTGELATNKLMFLVGVQFFHTQLALLLEHNNISEIFLVFTVYGLTVRTQLILIFLLTLQTILSCKINFYLFFFIVYRSAFRNGLIQGDKLVVYPILQWLFENLAELKKRAYLARYLVKLDVPPDQLADQELYELHENVSIILRDLRQLFLQMTFSLVKVNLKTLQSQLADPVNLR